MTPSSAPLSSLQHHALVQMRNLIKFCEDDKLFSELEAVLFTMMEPNEPVNFNPFYQRYRASLAHYYGFIEGEKIDGLKLNEKIAAKSKSIPEKTAFGNTLLKALDTLTGHKSFEKLKPLVHEEIANVIMYENRPHLYSMSSPRLKKLADIMEKISRFEPDKNMAAYCLLRWLIEYYGSEQISALIEDVKIVRSSLVYKISTNPFLSYVDTAYKALIDYQNEIRQSQNAIEAKTLSAVFEPLSAFKRTLVNHTTQLVINYFKQSIDNKLPTLSKLQQALLETETQIEALKTNKQEIENELRSLTARLTELKALPAPIIELGHVKSAIFKANTRADELKQAETHEVKILLSHKSDEKTGDYDFYECYPHLSLDDCKKHKVEISPAYRQELQTLANEKDKHFHIELKEAKFLMLRKQHSLEKSCTELEEKNNKLTEFKDKISQNLTEALANETTCAIAKMYQAIYQTKSLTHAYLKEYLSNNTLLFKEVFPEAILSEEDIRQYSLAIENAAPKGIKLTVNPHTFEVSVALSADKIPALANTNSIHVVPSAPPAHSLDNAHAGCGVKEEITDPSTFYPLPSAPEEEPYLCHETDILPISVDIYEENTTLESLSADNEFLMAQNQALNDESQARDKELSLKEAEIAQLSTKIACLAAYQKIFNEIKQLNHDIQHCLNSTPKPSTPTNSVATAARLLNLPRADTAAESIAPIN